MKQKIKYIFSSHENDDAGINAFAYERNIMAVTCRDISCLMIAQNTIFASSHEVL